MLQCQLAAHFKLASEKYSTFIVHLHGYAAAESKSSVIGKRKGPSKPGLGGRKGLGGQKVTSKNFEDAEKEATREDEERRQRGMEDAAEREE